MLGPFPYIPTFDALIPFQGQRASSLARDLYFHSIITCVSVFLLTIASVSSERDLITRGARQGKIRQPLKIMSMKPMRVLNPPNVENYPPKELSVVPALLSLYGDMCQFSDVCSYINYSLAIVISLEAAVRLIKFSTCFSFLC